MLHVCNPRGQGLGGAGRLQPGPGGGGPGVLPTPLTRAPGDTTDPRCTGARGCDWGGGGGPCCGHGRREESLVKTGNLPTPGPASAWLLTKYFLNILSRPPGPRAGCPCLPLPLLGQRTKARDGGRGREYDPPHPSSSAALSFAPRFLKGADEFCLLGGVAYRGSALGRGGHEFRQSPGQGHPVRAGGKPGPSPHPMAATVGEKTSQGQVVRCWGRQGGRGSGVTRPSWHRGGACTPPPRATREAQTIRGSPRVSPRAARSLGVATACSPPGLGGRVVGAYLGLGQTFQGLHNRLLGPRGLGLQREGRRAPSVWAEPGAGGLRVRGGRASREGQDGREVAAAPGAPLTFTMRPASTVGTSVNLLPSPTPNSCSFPELSRLGVGRKRVRRETTPETRKRRPRRRAVRAQGGGRRGALPPPLPRPGRRGEASRSWEPPTPRAR